MKKEIITDKAPAPVGTYSQAIKVGNRIYVSGQGSINPETGKSAETTDEQTRQVLTNIKNILQAAGATIDDVVKVTAYLADLKDFQEYDKVYSKFFTAPYPVRTTVGSQLLNTLVEIDVIAELNE
jgi:2-iminobutanoate/2-iminopropanoate deaminase